MKAKTDNPITRGGRAAHRRQRFMARRHEPPPRSTPFDVGRASTPSPEAELLADLEALVAAGLIAVEPSTGGDPRYRLVENVAGIGDEQSAPTTEGER